MNKFTDYFLTHLFVEDYIAFMLCWLGTIAYEWYIAHHYHPDNFSAKVLLVENWRKWVASLFCGVAMLYMLPEGVWEWFEKDWNTMYSGLVGLAPLLLFRKIMKTTKSKIREELK